jgi:hypothetical protein
LEPQKDIFPPGIEKATDVEELLARASATDVSSFSDEIIAERKQILKTLLTKQRITFQEVTEGTRYSVEFKFSIPRSSDAVSVALLILGRIFAMGSVSIWPPYRDIDCTSTAANAAAALNKIKTLIAKQMPPPSTATSTDT